MPRAARTPRFTAAAAKAPPQAGDRLCGMPGCGQVGEFRAPKSRDAVHDYHWLCLDHVRAFNAAWDYFRGMSPEQIEAHIRDDTTWQRPTWPLGRLGAAPRGNGRVDESLFRDPLDLLGRRRARRGGVGKDGTANGQAGAGGRTGTLAPPTVRPALAVMGLAWPLSLAELKARYKELVKRHHPDANGGDRAAEERLKSINQAYTTLVGTLAPRPVA